MPASNDVERTDDASDVQDHFDRDFDVDVSGPTDLRTRIGDEWRHWIATALAALLAVYFHLSEGLVGTKAERFYAIIFGAAAVAALAYGVSRVGTRRTTP